MSCVSHKCDVWYHQPIYDRYWRHYDMMHEWFQRCKNYELVGRERVSRNANFHTCSEQNRRGNRRYIGRKCRGNAKASKSYKTASKSAPPPVQINFSDTGDESVEEEESELEMEFLITDEYLEFVRQSEEFRKQRDAAKKLAQNSSDIEYVDVSTLSVEGLAATGVPDTAAKAAEKKKKMKQWYGKSSTAITGMETAMRCSFDWYRVNHNPSMWPGIPLRIQFD